MPTTLPICFKIPPETAELWCAPSTALPYSGHTLIGLQFEFKHLSGASGGNARVQIACSQIYGFDDEFPIRLELTGNIQDEGCEIFEIHGVGASTHLTLLDDTTSSSNYVYNRLQYFSSTCDYVYFGILDMRYKFEYFEEIHLSGCRLEFGSKTSSGDPGAVHSVSPVFSLKLEGKTVRPDVLGGAPDTLHAMIAGVSLGAPCPPTWYTFTT